MGLWQAVQRILDPAATHFAETFTLGDRGQQVGEALEQQRRRLRGAGANANFLGRRLERMLAAQPVIGDPQALKAAGDLSPDLEENLRRLRELFAMPDNVDLQVRRLQVATEPPLAAAVLFMEGMADKLIINTHILQPLLLLSGLAPGHDRGAADPVDYVLEHLLPGHEAKAEPLLQAAVESILLGDCAILFDGCTRLITMETKQPPVRDVDKPMSEDVIRGPHDAFNESFRVNVSLVRRRLKHARTVVQLLQVGSLSRTHVAIMYVDGVANPKLVAEARRRIEALHLDFMADSGTLEQLIEDSGSSLVPQMLSTERPDRVAASLAEGRVALLVDNSPDALIFPATFWSLMQTAEDYYLRWPYGTILRWVRFFALILAMLVPAIFVAATNYHHEMIPTELLLSIAASRELVPFPVVIELIIMELAFELVREAGIRIPHVIGPTIGIVGALILGQAAVAARIVSPILVIIVAITGLASFAIPNYSLQFAVRTLRFLFVALAAVLGLYGIAAGLALMVVHFSMLKGFGVPFLSPLAPFRGDLSDTLVRSGPEFQATRPVELRPMASWRTDRPLRRWDPMSWRIQRQKQDGDGDDP